MSRQYRSFDQPAAEQHQTEVCATHWLHKGPILSGSLDGNVKIWSASSEAARVGHLSCSSPHKAVMSISSSNSGRILSSDLRGRVAMWEAEEGTSDAIDLPDGRGEELGQRRSNWTLSLIDSKALPKGSYSVGGGEVGESSKQRTATCYVSKIHPTAPLFAATGSWAGATIYTCPSDDANGQLGQFVQYISDQSQTSRRGMSEKAGGAFGQSITFDSTGSKLAVGTDKGVVSLYDVESGSTMAVIQNQSSIIRAVEFTQTGELLVGSDQGSVTLYDLRTSHAAVVGQGERGWRDERQEHLHPSYVDTLKGHDFWITDVKAAGDGRHVATSSADGQLKVWDLRGEPTRSVVYQVKEERPMWSVCWKPDAGSSSFVTGTGRVDKASEGASSRATGNVRWYQISGSAA